MTAHELAHRLLGMKDLPVMIPDTLNRDHTECKGVWYYGIDYQIDLTSYGEAQDGPNS